jgi:hypothetical protein
MGMKLVCEGCLYGSVFECGDDERQRQKGGLFIYIKVTGCDSKEGVWLQ